MVDKHMTFERQILSVCRAAFTHLRIIHKSRHALTKWQLTTLCHSLVLSRIHFCASLYYGITKKLLKKLQRVVNSVNRVIAPPSTDDTIPPVRLLVSTRLLALCYKGMNGLAPYFITDMLHPQVITRTLRSNANKCLQTPYVKTAMGARAFSVSAPTFWNQLPLHVCDSNSLSSFVNQLSNYV